MAHEDLFPVLVPQLLSVLCKKQNNKKNHIAKQTPENPFSGYVHFYTNEWDLLRQEEYSFMQF